MLSNHRRRGTLRSFKMYVDNTAQQQQEEIFNDRVVEQLLTLNLPASLPSLDFMSPQLWSWLVMGDARPRVFSPSGEEILCLPLHLKNNSSSTTLADLDMNKCSSEDLRRSASVRPFRYKINFSNIIASQFQQLALCTLTVEYLFMMSSKLSVKRDSS